MANPAAIADSHWVAVRPVHETAQVIPFVQAPETYPVAQAERYPHGHVEVVRNQQRLPAAEAKYEPLVTGTVVIVGQQPDDDPGVLYPAVRIALLVEPVDGPPTRRSAAPS
jgi:hypothetical protein